MSSRLYFRINAGNRSLSTVFPAETTVNPGVTGADLVIYGAGTGSCDYEREDDAYLPKRTYQFMTPEDWQWDNTMSDTNFRYWARLNNGTFTQPKIKVTYLFKDGNTHTEVMGTPCVCNLTPAPQGCPLSLTAGNPVEFNKSIGGNISTASTPGGSEPTLNRGSLEPGTTIMVEIWCADGQGDANFYSTTTWDSYIEVPYAPNNFRVWGEVSPQYVERYAGADVQIKYRLWNDGAGAPTIRKLEITIPGHINNTSNFFDNVYVMSVSQGNSTTAITPASPGGNGAITVDFTANPVTGGFVDVIFTAKAPLAPVQTIKWEGKITTAGGSEYFLSERNIDSLFMAVLDFPWTPAGITVTPANTQNGGGALTISWPVSGSPASYDTLGVTQYVVFRDLGSTPVAQVPPSPYFNSAPTTWKPTTTVVLKSPQPYWNNTGLTNKTEYCYQVAAVSGVGVSATSAVVCGIPFAAPWPPATFTVKPANGMCRLDWTPSSPGSYTLTGYLVFRSSGAWTPVWVASVNGGASNTYDDPGLSNGLLYTYNVVPVDEYWNPGAATGNATGRPPANPPTNLTANYIDGSGVRLGWTPSSGNLFDVNGYNIYRATCTSCGLSVLVPSATSTVDNFTDTTAQRATLYLYAISATTIEPAESNLTSTVRILTPPAAPAWLTVAPRPGASLYLEWDDINPAGTVSGYRIYRATQTGAKWYKAAVTPQTATSWVDNSVSFGRRYYYSVASYTQRGTDYAESPPTSEFWRDVEPSTLPSITLTPWNNQVGLAWGDLRPSQFVETYAIFRATVPAVTATEYLGSTSNTYYDDATVVNEMTYWYWVAGENLGGSGVLTPAGSVMPFNPPGQPLSATAYAGQTYIRLEWTPTDPGTFGLAEYEILRATWPNVATTCPACIIATRPATSSIYTDYNDLISGVIYYYVVIAKDTNGNRGAPSPEAWNAPAIPPCAPAMLTAFSSTGWVDLSWSWVNHQTCMPLGTFPVSGYHLYRATAPLAPLASTTLTYDIYSTSYTDSEGGATLAGVTYYYRVRSWDNQPMPNETDDLLSMSPTVNATIRVPALEPAGLTIQYSPLEHDGKLKLTWVPSAKGTLDVVGYRVYRSTVVGGPETSDYVSGGSAGLYMDDPAANGTPYYYRVAPVEERWFEGNWGSVTGTPYRDPPVPLNLSLIEGDRQIQLSWSAQPKTTFAITAFQVYRATYSGITALSVIATVPAGTSSYWDTGLTNGILHYYHLRTLDEFFHQSYSFSAQATGTPWVGPAAPLNLTLTAGQYSITVGWDPAPMGTWPIGGYFLYRSSSPNLACGGTPRANVAGGLLSYVDNVGTSATVWHYRICAYDSVSMSHRGPCTSTASSQATLAEPPTIPANLTGLVASDMAYLRWNLSTQRTYPISGYNVYRSLTPGNPATTSEKVGETFGVTVSVYNDAAPSAPNGFVYYYRVRCRDQWSPAYLSGASNELALFVSDKVANIDATQPGNYTIDVSWDQLADPPTIGAAAVAGYEIYRSTWPANRFAPVGSTVGAASVNFTDTGVTHGIPVWYAVAARYDNGWLSPMSIGPSIMPSGPPSKPVLTLTATETGAMLTWLASVSNISSVTHYSVFRSTQGGSDGGVPELVNRTVLNYRDTALANGTLYYYRVAGYDSNTTSAYSDEAAVLPLATPRSLSAYPADDVIRLGWAVLTATAGIDSFEIYRYSTLEGEILAGTSPGGMATLFIDNNVDNGVPYTYRVRGVASTGSGPVYGMFSNVLGVSSAAPPSAPNNPSAVASTASIQVCWTAPSQGGTNGVAGYRVYRSTFAGGQAAPPLGTVTIPTVCYNDMAVTANTTYYYRISAYDTAAPAIEGPLSNEVYGKPYYNPSPPFGLTTVPGNNYLLITWKSPVITTYEVTRYNVYRGVTPGGEGPIPVNSTPVYATYYVDATAFNGTLYFYRIRATDVAGHTSVNSEEAYGRPYGAPGAPVNLSALPGNTVVMLTWGAAAAGTYGIAAYNIYRGSAPGTATTFVTSVSPTTLGLIDTASISATDYYYTVRTVDGQGHLSAPAPEIYVLPSDAIVNPPFDVGMTAGNGYIDLTWSFTVNGNTPGGPIDEYVILRSSPTCAMCTSVYVTATVMTHTDMTVMNGISYTYVVRSVRNAGPNIESLDYPGYNVVSAPAAPYVPAGAPGNFVVNAGMGAVEMRWDASTPGTFPVAAYRVYRGSPGCPCMTLVGTLDETIRVFADYGVANGTAYQYRVVAVDDNGNEGAAAISGTVIPNMRQTETYLSVNVFAPLRGERLDITYTLEKKSDVRVRIFTLAGLQVWETEMKDVPAGPSLGSYVIAAPDGLPGWDGRAPDKQFVSSGVYLIRIEAAGRKKTLKVIVIK